MKREYTQLTEKERQEIARLHLLGHSNRAIGRWLSRAHSTVWRELHRQPHPAQRYHATAAEARAQRCRHQRRTARKLADPVLRQTIRVQLAQGHSPEAIAGQLNSTGQGPLSRAPIYQWLRDEPALPYRVRLRRTAARHERIHDRVFLDQRSVAANDRSEALHFEGDTLGSPQVHCVRLATATCRVTRYTVIARVLDRSSASWCAAMAPRLRALGCRSLTVDNGMEFASHRDLAQALCAPVFFAHPGCPWERGTNEHHNGLLRLWLPKGTDIATVSDAQLQQIMEALNNRPRKQLGWRTPAEKMAELLAARRAPRGGRGSDGDPATTTMPQA
jgi:IS30 family transposase